MGVGAFGEGGISKLPTLHAGPDTGCPDSRRREVSPPASPPGGTGVPLVVEAPDLCHALQVEHGKGHGVQEVCVCVCKLFERVGAAVAVVVAVANVAVIVASPFRRFRHAVFSLVDGHYFYDFSMFGDRIRDVPVVREATSLTRELLKLIHEEHRFQPLIRDYFCRYNFDWMSRTQGKLHNFLSTETERTPHQGAKSWPVGAHFQEGQKCLMTGRLRENIFSCLLYFVATNSSIVRGLTVITWKTFCQPRSGIGTWQYNLQEIKWGKAGGSELHVRTGHHKEPYSGEGGGIRTQILGILCMYQGEVKKVALLPSLKIFQMEPTSLGSTTM